MMIPLILRPDASSRPLTRWLALTLPALLCACVQAPPTAGPPSPPTAAATAASAAADATLRLRIIAFNDFHGHLTDDGLNLSLPDPAHAGTSLRVPAGGAAALGGLVQALRAEAPHSLLVSSGDAVGAAPLVSTLFRHESTIEVMNQLGVDVGIVGNHEFDAGQDEALRLAHGGCAAADAHRAVKSCALHPHFEGAHFPLLAANIARPDGQPLLATHWVQTIDGVPVGFIGAITRSTPAIVRPAGITGLRFGDEAAAINHEAALLQAQGVHTLVAVIHEGGEVGEHTPGAAPNDWNGCAAWRGALAEIAPRITPAVDLILSAHTHQGYRCLDGDRPVLQATSFGRGVSVTDLQIDRATGRVLRSATLSANLPVLAPRVDAGTRESLAAALPAPFASALRQARPRADIAATVAAYQQAAAPIADRVVGRLGAGADRQGRGDSALGRLVADAQWAATRGPENGGAQFALMNAGGLRADLPCTPTAAPCPVTYGQVFTTQPFGNGLVVMSLSGDQLKRLLEQQQKPGHPQANILSPSAALSYQWQASAPAGQHVRDLRVEGRPVRPTQSYRVTVNGFLAEGGDGFTELAQGRDRVGGAQDVDALVQWLGEQVPLMPSMAPRVRWVD
jgi:5'-nucleotidase